MELESYFKGLADRNRLRIINLLTVGELCGCDIQYVLKVSQSNVSRHLTYLKNSGLVTDRRNGYRVYYSLTPKRSNAGLFAFLKRAFKDDKIFPSDIKKLHSAIKEGACTISMEKHGA
jgi:ArsR family transcriptional regulator, arsenate/arsenite/antimonite-responsive transcriptional repressor